MSSKKNILFVVTNADKYNDGSQTGVWLEEFTVPYLIFKDTGYDITVASIKGGDAPLDENSLSCSNPDEWDEAAKFLKDTKKLSDVNYEEFAAIYFPGGHGVMFDIAQSDEVKKAVEYFYNNHKIISAVCHGPAAFIHALDDNSEPITKGKKITAYTNKEEMITKTVDLIPFLLEDKFKKHGADFVEARPWVEHVEVDGHIITGQNPASSIAVAEQVIKKLK